MAVVFINYRRGETAGEARALFNELAEVLGKDSVFMDVDTIALGRDFRQVIRERLESCDLMLALIGRDWLDSRNASGRRRLEDPADFVRLEIEAALKRNIPVTPVLVQGAQMPAVGELPEDIRDFAYRNGFELSHNRWESDVREMLKRLNLSRESGIEPGYEKHEPVTKSAIESSPAPGPRGVAQRSVKPKLNQKHWLAIVGASAVVIAFASGGILYYRSVAERNAEIERALLVSAKAKSEAEAAARAAAAQAEREHAAAQEAAAQAERERAAAQEALAQAEKEKETAEAERKRIAEAESERKRRAEAQARQAELERRELAARAERERAASQAAAEAERQRLAEAEEARKRQAAQAAKERAAAQVLSLSANRFVGRWVNANSDTRSITRIEVVRRVNRLYIRMWGKCHPTDCDWGTASTDITDLRNGGLPVKWTKSFAVTRQYLSILPNNRLKVSGATHFTDNSGRRDYGSTDYFVRR